MSNEDVSEDRLTKSEFAELIQHLSMQEILTIEYRIATNWSKLFSRKHVSLQQMNCNLCGLEVSSFKNLLSHIDGKKHKLKMGSVKQLYHPDYTHPKNYKEVLVGKAMTKKTENVSTSSTTKSVANKSSLVTVVDDNKKSENETLQNKATNKTPLIKPCNTFEINKAVDNCSTINNQKKINETMSLTSTQIASKGKEVDKEALNSSKITNSDACNQDEVKKYEIENQKPTSDSNELQDTDKEMLNSEPSSKKTLKIPSLAAAKRLSNNEAVGEVKVKKAKIVINPAAAFYSKATSIKTNEDKYEDSKEKPQYQTDKIIIPSMHKINSEDDKVPTPTTTQTSSSNLPKFSVKSYSSKPSDNDVHGILGVEYVIKILKSRHDIAPRYECGLCELIFDGFVMQKHLEGYNHRLKYCEKHFPTAIRHYRQYMQNVPESEIFKVMTPVLEKLALAIEKHHGRNLPYECYERDFSLNRHEILAKAFSCRHASEQYGPTFTHVIGSKEIDEIINNRHNYSPPSSSRIAIFDMKPGSTSSKSDVRQQNSRNAEKESNARDRHRHDGRGNVDSSYKSYMSTGIYEDMYSPLNTYAQGDNRNVVQHVDDETYNLMVDNFLKGTLKGIPGNSRLRDHRSMENRKSLSPLRQNDIWQAYRHMVDQELNKLDDSFKKYRKDPETHPSYNEEWQKFWKRRKDELVSAGLDHRKYNYQPEWVRFIKIRIEELYGQEVENLKIKSRERLCLPLTNENVNDDKYHVHTPKICYTDETTNAPCNTDAPVSQSTAPSTSFSSDNTPQVVSVLRLMTALEDCLGSLGPKIIDLLSKALQAEKTHPSHVNAIILNDDNCSLIETAKEKFKGLIITCLFEGSKERVLKQVVNDAEGLLKYSNQFRQQLASQRSSIESSINRKQTNASFLHDSASANFCGTIINQQSQSTKPMVKKTKSSLPTDNLLTCMDKKELASKLAASLVAQGKTDFDPQQLQQLIAVYKLIEKKKRENTGTAPTNKGSESSMPESTSSKKALSDTLSDLLKTSSYATPNPNHPSTSQSAQGLSHQTLGGRTFSSNNTNAFANCFPLNSFTSVSQNSSDNYFNNTAQSMTNTYGVGEHSRGNLFEQHSGYGQNYTNNQHSHQQNSSMREAYNNTQYQNNNRMMSHNWGWNSNMEMNQNNNMGGPNNSYNQSSH